MIRILFGYGPEKVIVIIKETKITFGNTAFGAQEATIDGLRLNHEGVITQFPDLKDNPDWKEQAIDRFKEKIKDFKNENERATYIIEELKPHGYFPEKKQIDGFRPVNL